MTGQELATALRKSARATVRLDDGVEFDVVVLSVSVEPMIGLQGVRVEAASTGAPRLTRLTGGGLVRHDEIAGKD